MARSDPAAPVPFPAVVLVDSREQLPYEFAGLTADRRDGGGLLAVTVRRAGLPTGDYSLDGYTDRVAVERKSLNDLYHTLGQERERFERELERLAAMTWAAVVVEAEWSVILGNPPAHSKLNPKTVLRSVLAWQQRFPNVHWLPMPDRRFAEAVTLRALERFLKERQREKHDEAARDHAKRPVRPAPGTRRRRAVVRRDGERTGRGAAVPAQ